MKYTAVISSLTILFTGFLLIQYFDSWRPKKDLPEKKIQKSSPVNEPVPVKTQPQELKKDTLLQIPLDSIKIIPSDSLLTSPSTDTIRATQQIERKPDIRFYKRIRQYNLHRRSPIA